MFRRRLRATLMICLALLGVPVAGRADMPAPEPVAISLRAGHVWIDGTLNGKQAHFIIDTGAGGMLVTPDAARRCGMVSDNQQAVVAGASDVDAPRGVAQSIGVGSALLRNQEVFIVALPEQLAGCDGLLGFPFLKRFVVTIDYADLDCTIGGTSTNGGHPWLPLHFENNIPVIDGRLEGDAWARFEVDSGSGAAAMLWSPYVKQNGLLAHYTPRIATITGRGIGGLTYGDMIRVPTLTLGNKKIPGESVTLKGVVVELSRQAEGGFYSNKSAGQIGADILRRFTVTFDYAQRRILLVPNADFPQPFVYDRVGMHVDEQKGRFVVVDVTTGSPADQAGVRTGDEITAVDGVAVDRVTAVGIYDKLHQPVGTPMHVQGRHSDQTPLDATFTLKDLL